MAREIDKIVEYFVRFPGIGPRQARRIGFYLASLDEREVRKLADALIDLKKLRRCKACFSITNLDNNDLCSVCSDTTRNSALVAIVEKETDLDTIENTRKFKGRYLVLGGLSRDGILSPEHRRRLATLKDLDEVIIALSPTAYGDVNSSAIELDIKKLTKKVSRLGRGMPTGAELEFADEETLSGALENRK